MLSHLGVSRYDALQLTVAPPLANGLSLSASYVFSKVLSNLDDYRPGAVGNLQRRMFAGPGAFNLNLGLRKAVALTERVSAEFRAESINLFNNVNWLVGDQTYLGSNQGNNAAVFDNNVTQWNAPRTFQFSLRLLF